MVALTKTDLVDDEWRELVSDDLSRVLEGTFLEGAPVVPCSAVNGRGMDQIKETLASLAAGVRPRDPAGLLRLPMDRVFTMKGFGTVVTGTLTSGTVRLGDEVAVLPYNVTGKVRGLQVHGQAVEQAVAGQRTAVNLGGVDRQSVARGEVLVQPDTLRPSRMMETMVSLLPGVVRPLKQRSKVLFHLGTRQQEATCMLLDHERLEPGASAVAQLRFEVPVVALPGDHFILRGFHKQENYGTTVGGGEVVRVLSRKVRPRDRDTIRLLQQMAAAPPDQRVLLEIEGAGLTGLTRADLQQRLPMVPAAVDRTLKELLGLRQVVRFDKDRGSVIHHEHFATLQGRLLEFVDRFHADTPLEAGISREELRSRLRTGTDPRLYHALLSDLQKQGELTVDQQICHRPTHKVRAAAATIRPLADRILRIFQRAGLGSPREAQVVDQAGADPEDVAAAIKLLVDEGSLVRVTKLLFAAPHVEDLQARLVRLLEQQDQITAQQFKDLVGQSRKYAIPLAEYFDSRKVTLRIGDIRQLRR